MSITKQFKNSVLSYSKLCYYSTYQQQEMVISTLFTYQLFLHVQEFTQQQKQRSFNKLFYYSTYQQLKMSVLGESGNCARGPGESGRDKFHSPGNRGMKKCRGTRGIGDLGFPVEPLRTYLPIYYLPTFKLAFYSPTLEARRN